MMKLFLTLFLIGCGAENTSVLSIAPLTTYTPTLKEASSLTYTSNTIRVSGFLGQFKIVLTNLSDKPLTNVSVVATVNDQNLVGDIFFSRIYHEIFWGGSVFSFSTPAILPDNKPLPGTGFYTTLVGDDLPPHSSLTFDSILFGNPGLVLSLQAYASLPDNNTAVSTGQTETVILF